MALILAAAAAIAMGTPMAASAAPSSSNSPTAPPCTISAQQVKNAGHNIHAAGVIVAAGTSSTCQDPPPPPEPAFNGTPPLLFHGSPPTCFFSPCENGNVMMTVTNGPLIVTPIFWIPPGGSMSPTYRSIMLAYLAAVAAASGRDSNVFSVANEYFGNNGQIHYNIRLGVPVNDNHPIKNGCTLEAADRTGIYADGSGYNACVDDAQLQGEIDRITALGGLQHNLRNIYVLFLPKHVESCFLPGETTDPSDGQFCTINHQPTAAFCAYHNESASSAVYADLAYPIYQSPVGFTCGSDARFPVVESPNGNPDGDTEVSPVSHEMNEAITDPDTETGWYDRTGNENGDDCAYIYGATQGTPGRLYNQTIAGFHFLTQQEFSNNVFKASHGKAGCVDSLADE
jgi:hypothetical protein